MSRLKQWSDAGELNFSRFMEIALYDESDGYYQKAVKIGLQDADFYTAAQFSLFSATLGQYAFLRWRDFGEPLELQVVEYGAGQGELAQGIARQLLATLPKGVHVRYVIVDPSPMLRQLQAERLAADGLQNSERIHFCWEEPDASLDTVFVGNEVLDALPVEIVRRTKLGWEQAFVTIADSGQASFSWGAAAPEIASSAMKYVDCPEGTQAEVCPGLDEFFRQLSRIGRNIRGLFIDYGITTGAWRDGMRPQGTIRAFSSHRVTDVLSSPGLSDITSDVNWDHAYASAAKAGFRVLPLQSQGQFLLSSGILNVLESMTDSSAFEDANRRRVALTNQLKQLVLPGGMGERFSVMECDWMAGEHSC
ncbi:SAM-dependent methyltransferase [Alicyclobacillus tolerans]|uniref:SAM-dependent methyltransferase n=1 Tax=Alicyclobacillus tolerans TaxID=90970 RepID=UPI001F3047F8|nr:SAM-dependent methyltransferase [Alicyclobacillus tolerans]MCF8564501.1 SAM-dependent methyltransferase [Alicyclobacillus tolerans]